MELYTRILEATSKGSPSDGEGRRTIGTSRTGVRMPPGYPFSYLFVPLHTQVVGTGVCKMESQRYFNSNPDNTQVSK